MKIKQASAIHGQNVTILVMAWVLAVIVSICLVGTVFGQETKQQKKFKILHVMSYHASWEWTISQLAGFKKPLEGYDIEYKILEMDTKRNNAPEWIIGKAKAGRELIESFQPDLVYVNDDIAQEHITKQYINSDLPFVFSAVNANPYRYGFVGSSNVTGVLEQEHFVETVNLLRKIVPRVKTIAVILDEDPTWEGVSGRMMEKAPTIPDFKISRWFIIKTFEQYKQTLAALQNEVDALALLGIFNFKGDDGKNVPYTDVLRWTAENSNLPDFSFWKDRISYGTLCTVTVSGYEQGLEAGKMAYAILIDQKPPASIPIKPTIRGEAVVSMARAKKLGIQIKSNVLLTAEVISKFNWEQ